MTGKLFFPTKIKFGLHKIQKRKFLFPTDSEVCVTQKSKKGNICADPLILAGINFTPIF